jgi:uracil-DNA glycosylase
MEKTINISKIKEKISQISLDANWKAIDFFVQQFEFQIIIEELIKEYNLNYKATPRISEAFNGILTCPVNNVKVLIIGQDPYPQKGVADGIAFSCSKTKKEQPSLKHIFNEVEKLYPEGYDRDPNLQKWTRQGIIMLNTALTCRVGDIGSHYHIWKGFTAFFLEYLNRSNKDCITVLLGKKAEEWSKYVNNHDVIKVSHPASAAYTGGNWDSNNLFETINKKLQKLGKKPIIW